MTPDQGNQAMKRLAKLAQQREALEEEIRGLVGMLRQPTFGYDTYCSWGAIAELLGVSRQAVQQRYGGKR